MLGGIICDIRFGAERILIHVRGVGNYGDKVTSIAIAPTNYRLRVGDLIWWNHHGVHWEGKTLDTAKDLPALP